MNQFSAMQAFVKVAETSSFSEAARQLGVAVSSVTRQVNALEAMLHTPLFNRSTRRVTLTPQGERYYSKVVQILQDVEAANLSVTEQDDIPRGLLRVNAPVAFGRLHIAPLLSEFLARYPHLQLDLTLSDRLANPVEEGLDVVIRIGNLDRSGTTWLVRKLTDSTRKLCASPAYLQRQGEPQHLNELAHHNCLCFSYTTGYDTWRFKRDTEICEVTVTGSLVVNNSEVLRQACLDGVGLILMPTWLIGADLQSGALQSVLPDCQFYPHTQVDDGIYALYLPNRRNSMRVQAFVDFLIQRLGAAGSGFSRPSSM